MGGSETAQLGKNPRVRNHAGSVSCTNNANEHRLRLVESATPTATCHLPVCKCSPTSRAAPVSVTCNPLDTKLAGNRHALLPMLPLPPPPTTSRCFASCLLLRPYAHGIAPISLFYTSRIRDFSLFDTHIRIRGVYSLSLPI